MIKNLAGTLMCSYKYKLYVHIQMCVNIYICTHMSFEYLLFVIGCKIAASFKAEKLPVLLGSGNSPHPLRITPPTTTIKQKKQETYPPGELTYPFPKVCLKMMFLFPFGGIGETSFPGGYPTTHGRWISWVSRDWRRCASSYRPNNPPSAWRELRG